MPLSNAEKQRRYRARKAEAARAKSRAERGLPAELPEPDVPEGAWLTSNGFLRAKYGWYEAAPDVFKRVPSELMEATMTTANGEVVPVPETYAKQRAREAAAETESNRGQPDQGGRHGRPIQQPVAG